MTDLEEKYRKLRQAVHVAGFGIMETSGAWSIHEVTDRAKAQEAVDLRIANEMVDLQVENRKLKNGTKLVAQLSDVEDSSTMPVTVTAESSHHHLEVKIDGYGERGVDNGAPVVLELVSGEMRVLVFADITMEEPTHIISLEGARLSLRAPDDKD